MSSNVTRILAQIEAGDPVAAEQLLPLVYDELRKLATARLAREQPGQTLQPTALVHEAYLRLLGGAEEQRWNSRGHFFGAAAEAMRRILVEQARRKECAKRGGGWVRNQQPIEDICGPDLSEEVLAIDEALHKLSQENAVVARVVELRYFVGLSVEEIATVLNLSVRTVQRYWVYAKAWLMQELHDLNLS